MARFTMFNKPVTRTVHKTRMLNMMRLFTEAGLRGSPVHKQQQAFLIRNRYMWGRYNPKFLVLLARFQ